MTSVLITGFGRFPGAPFNPSGPVALALAKRRRPALADVRRAVHVFETSYAAVDRDLPKLIAKHKPDIVLMFGLAARTPFVRIETRARNAMSILFPDVTGFRPAKRQIAPGKPALRGSAPFYRLLGASRATGARSSLSRDAGRYLCNYVYWRGLEASRSGTPLVQFIHIPPVSKWPRPPGGKLRASHAALVRAGEAILLALLATRRHLPKRAVPARHSARGALLEAQVPPLEERHEYRPPLFSRSHRRDRRMERDRSRRRARIDHGAGVGPWR